MASASAGVRGLAAGRSDVAASFQERESRISARPAGVPPSSLSSASSSLFSPATAERTPYLSAFAGAKRAMLAWNNPRAATRSEGVAEEERLQSMLSKDDSHPSSVSMLDDTVDFPSIIPQVFSSTNPNKESEDPNANRDGGSSLDRLEKQARSSLARLKHILYKLKTRPSDVQTSTTLLESNAVTDPLANHPAGTDSSVEEEQQFFVSQQIKVDLSEDVPLSTVDSPPPSPSHPEASVTPRAAVKADRALASLLQANGPAELELQLDGVTWTRATVRFDEKSQTAIMSVTATVRASELQNPDACKERTVAMAAQALARTCLVLDRRARQQAQAAAAAAASAASAAAAAATSALGLSGAAMSPSAPTARAPIPRSKTSVTSTSAAATSAAVPRSTTLPPSIVPRQKSLEAEDLTDFRTGLKGMVGERPSLKREQLLLNVLESGEVVSWKREMFGHGATPFRPVYVVELKAGEGRKNVRALFRPMAQGDRQLRWQGTMAECVAFKVRIPCHFISSLSVEM